MCAPARHAQVRRSVSSSAWSQPASRRHATRATGRGRARRTSRPASPGCRGLDPLACDAKKGGGRRAAQRVCQSKTSGRGDYATNGTGNFTFRWKCT
eukprot:scaffold28298_cov68-Phaeocystis_antarctica.AAC.1